MRQWQWRPELQQTLFDCYFFLVQTAVAVVLRWVALRQVSFVFFFIFYFSFWKRGERERTDGRAHLSRAVANLISLHAIRTITTAAAAAMFSKVLSLSPLVGGVGEIWKKRTDGGRPCLVDREKERVKLGAEGWAISYYSMG